MIKIGQRLILKNQDLWQTRGVCGQKGKFSTFEQLSNLEPINRNYCIFNVETCGIILNIQYENLIAGDVIVYFEEHNFSALFNKSEIYTQFKTFFHHGRIWQELND